VTAPGPQDGGVAAPAAGGWRVYGEAAALRMLALGFGAGMPFTLIYATLPFRLREAGVALATIGFMSWIVLVYPFKWAWAPLMDRWSVPLLARWLGARRAWLLAAQAGLIVGLALMGLLDARAQLPILVGSALFTALCGATQDVALDAYRIESAPIERQAALAAMYHSGYRLGMIWGGAGALWLAARAAPDGGGYQPQAWTLAYAAMAASMLLPVLIVLLAPRPAALAGAAAGARVPATLLSPFFDFARRWGWHALLILGLISSYRLANLLMGVMANPFYHDIGFTKDQIAAVSKIYGVALSLLGGFAGGLLALRVGIWRLLWGAAIASAASILLYALLATRGPDLLLLGIAVSADNFAEGVAGTAFIAYLSSLTNRAYSATQYALLSSAALLLPKVAAGFSGVLVEHVGFAVFFCGCAASGGITLAFLWAVQRYVPAQRFSNR